jgi:hypothetical protein
MCRARINADFSLVADPAVRLWLLLRSSIDLEQQSVDAEFDGLARLLIVVAEVSGAVRTVD